MIKRVINKHNALTLTELVEMAKEQEIKLVICTLKMILLAFQKD